MIATYQTRVTDYDGTCRDGGDAALSAYAGLYGHVQRKLFAAVAAGRSSAEMKRAYLRRYRIPARMFNSIRVSLDGKVAAVKESMALRRESLERNIARTQGQVTRAESRGRLQVAHQKRRKLGILEHRLAALKADIQAGKVRICFGSKKLWRARLNLEANGYRSHEEWLKDWRDARNSEFFVMGSRDETAGCQLCVATVAPDGTLNLRLRMPDALAQRHGKYLPIRKVRFAYGHDQVLAAVTNNADRAAGRGQPISYRFKRDTKGWRVFVTTEMSNVSVVTDSRQGVIGVDLNPDHLAVAETDPSGNFLKAWSVPLVTYGKTSRQAEALIGDAVASVAGYARGAGKPVVIEELDFRRKKASLKGTPGKVARMLSSFSYGKVKAYFLSRCYREGVALHQVNPACSSIIGRVKFMERYGLSVHQAAALVLARRLPGFSERIPRQRVCPVGNGVHVAFTLPARKRVKHVWTYWNSVSRKLGPALAAQRRLGQGPGPPQSGPGCQEGVIPKGGLVMDQIGVPG